MKVSLLALAAILLASSTSAAPSPKGVIELSKEVMVCDNLNDVSDISQMVQQGDYHAASRLMSQCRYIQPGTKVYVQEHVEGKTVPFECLRVQGEMRCAWSFPISNMRYHD